MKPLVVSHEIHGRGKVISTRSGGREFCVDFEHGPTRWVWAIDLSTVGPDEPTVTGEKPESPVPVIIRQPPKPIPNGSASFSRAKERRIIHALRLGIVPDDAVIHFTFGRDVEMNYLLNWLEDDARRCLYLTGLYGSGKTHLLNHIAHQAFQAGFVVASMQVDEKEAPFYRPLRVYQRLAGNLTFQMSQEFGPQDIRRLLQLAVRRDLLKDHRLFSLLYGRSTEEALLRWITGNGGTRPAVEGLTSSKTLPLVDHTNAANLYCYLLSGIGWAARQLGFGGLLLIFDEAETLTTQTAKRQREMANNFFASLYRTAYNDRDMLGPPHKTEFQYSRTSPLAAMTPFLYKEQSGLKLIFAFAMDDDNAEIEKGREDRLALTVLSEEARRSILDEVIAMYRRAYQYEKPLDTEWIFEIVESKTYGMTRQFVKGCVEALDLIRHSESPDFDFDEVLQ